MDVVDDEGGGGEAGHEVEEESHHRSSAIEFSVDETEAASLLLHPSVQCSLDYITR